MGSIGRGRSLVGERAPEDAVSYPNLRYLAQAKSKGKAETTEVIAEALLVLIDLEKQPNKLPFNTALRLSRLEDRAKAVCEGK